MIEKRTVTLTINGEQRSAEAAPRMLLADFLRERLGLTGTHVGCEHGVCGACTIHVNGEAARSCLMLAVQVDGAEITTIEGLADGEVMHPLQKLFSEHRALQCGFCTPGMMMTALDLVASKPDLTIEEIRTGMSAVLCRCTGYEGIVNAVEAYAKKIRNGEA
ncbi:MAG: (2Fe-2S)-binding protein [Rhodospirillaceae bacterium]|jgi:aerobic carbon-monoxide dehydrogenase small subunit|nr:(2Fe-2S)-binding protein [Rhodospirillaceae bacterium]MBT5459203.1 (2Fe-2S)-binding protein [Rhodospirillaceae bacterium]